MNERKLRIAHVCLASAYTEGMTYQDNILPAQNRKDGHEVLIVADCAAYIDGKLLPVAPEDKVLQDGSRLVRLPFAGRLLPRYVRDKVRIAPQLTWLLESFRPDVILYHGVIGAELLTVGAYKKKYPHTRLFVDCHEDFNNSGRSATSRILQYKLLTRYLWNRIAPLVDKVLYVSYECRDFLRAMYAIPEQDMEFYPLGGYVQDPQAKAAVRRRIRDELGLSDGEVVFIHAGKLDRAKRTLDILQAFVATPEPSFRMLVVGAVADDIQEDASALMKADPRIRFLGWKSGAELVDLLCASDCYLQPGTQSATLQVALCCGLPVVIHPYSSHEPYLAGNGFYVRSPEDIAASLPQFGDADARRRMSDASFEIGRKLLDYRALARRLYQ
jgi:glycosyltransferase involved in cell wall biosynthesis